MKNIYHYSFFGLLLFLSACVKEAKLPDLNFNLSVEIATVQAGEEVNFLFEGNPGLITFYSGEPGNLYEFKNQERIARLVELTMSLETSVQAVETSPLTLWFSKDFNGVYTYEDVARATWIEFPISSYLSQAVYPAFGSSGDVDLSDLLGDDKPFYLAFRYDTPAVPTGTLPLRRWRFRNFRLIGADNFGGEERLAFNTVGSAGWQFVPREPDFEHISLIPAATGVQIQIIPPNLNTQVGWREEMQLWTVSRMFDPAVNLGVDYGVSIKNYQTSSMQNYRYAYDEPGVYKATFVAANTTIYDSKEMVKEVEITVLP